MENEDIQSGQNILNDIKEDSRKEFNNLYGWLDLGLQVAKEIGSPYLEVVELPAINVLTLTSYLSAKVKQIEEQYKTR